MTSNGVGRSVSHNTFGDYAQIIQGDFNVSVHPPKKALELDYLHEATFNATNKQHAPGCLENTRIQVLSQIRSWIDGDGERRIYWLRGMAGTGKTTISMTIAREYYGKGRLGASFFFSRSSGDLSSTRKFVATIANELAESLLAYREHLHNALESSSSITSRSLYDQWEKLILDPMRSTLLEDDVQPILIVIDALDECNSQYDLGVLIQCLADLAALDKIAFRIFITSRPEKTIHLGFDKIMSTTRQEFTLHNIEESIVAADLQLYYRHELHDMDIDESPITEDVIDILTKKSDGLFIHAATVCRFIRQGEIYAATRLSSFIASQESQLEPERELDSIYTTILENAFAKFATLRSGEMETLQLSYQKVVGSVVMLYDRMSPADFATMVGEPEENVIRLLKHLGSVLDVPQEASGHINVLHTSFRDFLSDPGRSSTSYFPSTTERIHANLLQRCLDIMTNELRKNIYRLRQPGKRTEDISRSAVDGHVSQVLQYACKYWIYHLQQSFQGLPTGIRRNVGSSGTKVTYQTLRAVVQDATRFLYAHSSIIEAAPLQLYISALIFSPRTSLIRRIYRHQIPGWILSIPSLSESWDPQLRRLYHPDAAEVVAYSPDGKMMASGHLGSTVCLWDAITGAQRRTLEGHSEDIISLSFSPNSNLLVSASDDETIRLWNAITGVKIRAYRRRHRIRSVAFLPDGKRVSRRTGDIDHGYGDMTISPDGKHIAYAENGKTLHNAKCFDMHVMSIAFSPDSKLLGVALHESIELWNAATGATRRILLDELPHEILNVASGKIWCELRDAYLRCMGRPQRFAFSPDGSAIASILGSSGVSVWDTRFSTKHVDSELNWEHSSTVTASPDDILFASASYSDALRLWDGQTGAKREIYVHRLRPLIDMLSNTRRLKKLIGRFKKLAFPGINFEDRKKLNISSITFSMDGRLFACIWKTKKLQVWDAQNGKMRFARKLDSSTSDNAVFSPDNKLIAILSDKIHFWDTNTGSEAYSSEAPLGRAQSIAFSPNGIYLVSSIPTNVENVEPSVYDNGDFYGYSHLSAFLESDGLFQFSSNSKLLAYRFSDRIMVLNVETREFVHTLKCGHWSYLMKLSIFHDSRFLGALHSMGNVFIWDLVTRSIVHASIMGATESSLCFSLSGKHIASLDNIIAYNSSQSANCHSAGISFTRAWIKDGGHNIVYFPHEFKELYDFMAGSALVFRWPPTGFFREAIQHLGCNMLQFAMVDKVMDED
ncbi:hypothetical protein GGI35DRAFT_466219 [Trichoderma velutinum]